MAREFVRALEEVPSEGKDIFRIIQNGEHAVPQDDELAGFYKENGRQREAFIGKYDANNEEISFYPTVHLVYDREKQEFNSSYTDPRDRSIDYYDKSVPLPDSTQELLEEKL